MPFFHRLRKGQEQNFAMNFLKLVALVYIFIIAESKRASVGSLAKELKKLRKALKKTEKELEKDIKKKADKVKPKFYFHIFSNAKATGRLKRIALR